MAIEFFDELVPGYTDELVELQPDGDSSLEVFRRVMIVLKASMDDKPFVVTTTAPSREIVLANQAMLDYLGYTQEEIQALDGEDIFDSRDYSTIAQPIGDNNLTAPYCVRVMKKSSVVKFVKIQGLSIKANGISWRFLIFDEVDLSL